MRRGYIALVAVGAIGVGLLGGRLFAIETVIWDGTSSDQWHEENWTKNGMTGLSAAAAIGQDGNTGGRGGVDMIIGGGAMVEHNHNRNGEPPSGDPSGQGDFKPRMDLVSGGSLTIKEGATLFMDSHTDFDGRWTRVGLDITLDNGTLRRTFSNPSSSGGRIIFGYQNELLPNQKININVINGGRIESAGKMVFGEPDLAPDIGHNPGIEVAMTINGGTLDLTGGADYPDFFGLANGEIIFFYEYDTVNNTPLNEEYSINFTGPGTIIVDNGIFVAAKDASGAFNPLGGPSDLATPLTYEALWNLGLLQANGQSGMTGATFSNFFSTTGTSGLADYTLTSLLVPAGVLGDYNDDGKVDAADYVRWRDGGPLENEVVTIGSATPEDYTEWHARFGGQLGSGVGLESSVVPEPASLLLIAIGIAGASIYRKSKGTR